MKKIILPLVFAVLAMLSFNNATTASTTINFNLKVVDGGNCGMPYYGYYYVRIHIILNGTEICQHDQYNIVNTTVSQYTQVTWVCSITFYQSDKYVVQFDICRYTAPNTFYCCQTVYPNPEPTMNDLTDGSTITINPS